MDVSFRQYQLVKLHECLPMVIIVAKFFYGPFTRKAYSGRCDYNGTESFKGHMPFLTSPSSKISELLSSFPFRPFSNIPWQWIPLCSE